MPLPTGWPPRPATNTRSARVFIEGITTLNFADNAYLFMEVPGANTVAPTPYVKPGSTTPVRYGNYLRSGSPMGGREIPEDAYVGLGMTFPDGGEAPPKAMMWVQTLVIINDGADDIEISFDAINVHRKLGPEESRTYRNCYEAGIAVRTVAGGAPAAFRVEGW